MNENRDRFEISFKHIMDNGDNVSSSKIEVDGDITFEDLSNKIVNCCKILDFTQNTVNDWFGRDEDGYLIDLDNYVKLEDVEEYYKEHYAEDVINTSSCRCCDKSCTDTSATMNGYNSINASKKIKSTIYASLDKDTMQIWDTADVNKDIIKFDIKFCPMCGRKLGEKDEN